MSARCVSRSDEQLGAAESVNVGPLDGRIAVSALVCTRNRPDSLIRAVRSLLLPRGAAIELIVMDQSSGFETAERLAEIRDPRLVYVKTDSRGKGAALNEGLRLARGPTVVCTDDDCEAAADWVVAMGQALSAEPKVSVLFCNVVAGPYAPGTGYIPVFKRHESVRLTSVADASKGFGLGAGMALRRDAILALGGFDETFGPGARFASGDDWDIALRALIAGSHILEVADLAIVHHGFRTYEQGRDHALRDWIAIGALCAKPIRAGHINVMRLGVRLFGVHALWPPMRDVLHLRRPSGASRIMGFIQGFARGIQTPVDPKTLRFRLELAAAPRQRQYSP